MKLLSNLKSKLIEYLLNEKHYTEEQIKAINKFKIAFKTFFEGAYGIDQIYDTPMSILNFGITNLKFDFPNNDMVITITLERPGMLIGKGGHTIDSLTKHLNEWSFENDFENVKINIVESKLWEQTPIK